MTFQYSSLHKTIGPVCIMFSSKSRPTSLTIRFERNGVGPGMEFINEEWQKILPGYPLKYQFYDEWFDSMYRSEEYFARNISLFAILAVVISCIGILGLAIFSSDRRTKEIGIRKINGAGIREILIILNKDFIKLVIIAYIIAIPIAWYSMHKWLENFAYRTELSWWIFVSVGISGTRYCTIYSELAELECSDKESCLPESHFSTGINTDKSTCCSHGLRCFPEKSYSTIDA